MSESLRNDGRIWVPKNPDETRPADQVPEDERDYYLERIYPSFGNLAPRDVSSRAAKRMVDAGQGVGPLKNGVYLDFAEAIGRLGESTIRERYGNLFDMYERITGENPYDVPMRIYPASHYTMGGLWVDYELMTTDPRPLLRRRGQLLRPRREPPRRVGPHAGPVRRLLRAAVHDLAVPVGLAQQADPRRLRTRSSQGPAGGAAIASRGTWPSAAPAAPTTSTVNSARSSGTTAAWIATPTASRRRCRRSRRCTRSSRRT